MKKALVLGALVLTLGAGTMVTYAANVKSTDNVSQSIKNETLDLEDKEAWFKERMEFKKDQINKALEEGLITEEQAKTWEEHFAYMEKFHEENGFMPGSGCGNGMGMRGNKGKGRNGMFRGMGL